MKITLTEGDRAEQERWLKSQSVGDKQRLRARMVLMTADGLSTTVIMAMLSVSNPTLNKWWTRNFKSGAGGLKKCKTHPSRAPTLPTDKVQELLALKLTGKPVAATHFHWIYLVAANNRYVICEMMYLSLRNFYQAP